MQWKKIQCSPSKPVRALSSLPPPGGHRNSRAGPAVRCKYLANVLLHLAKTPKWLFWEAHRWEKPHSTMLTHSRIQHAWAAVPMQGLSSSTKKMKIVIEGPRWALFMFYQFLRLSYSTVFPLLLLLFYKLFLINRIKWRLNLGDS